MVLRAEGGEMDRSEGFAGVVGGGRARARARAKATTEKTVKRKEWIGMLV